MLLVGEGGDEVLGGYLRLAITKFCDINFRDKNQKKETFKNLQKYFNLNQQQIEKINDFKN